MKFSNNLASDMTEEEILSNFPDLTREELKAHQRGFLFGAPPKVVWVRLGNCSTSDVVDLSRHHVNAPSTRFTVTRLLRF